MKQNKTQACVNLKGRWKLFLLLLASFPQYWQKCILRELENAAQRYLLVGSAFRTKQKKLKNNMSLNSENILTFRNSAHTSGSISRKWTFTSSCDTWNIQTSLNSNVVLFCGQIEHLLGTDSVVASFSMRT